MRQGTLGEFEEIVMLTVGVLYNEAYGVSIKKEIEAQSGRNVSVGALQSALKRLEKKGYLESRIGESTGNRGGRPKRYFTITPTGKLVLEHARDVRMKLWQLIPKTAFQL